MLRGNRSLRRQSPHIDPAPQRKMAGNLDGWHDATHWQTPTRLRNATTSGRCPRDPLTFGEPFPVCFAYEHEADLVMSGSTTLTFYC